LSQPQPARELAGLLARALHGLAQLDADRAVVIARRALDVLGPRHDELRAAILGAADSAGDHAFAAALFERWIAAGPSPAEKQQLLLKLAERRSKLGDVDGEVRALTRALREGMDPAEISTRIVGLTSDTLSGDGEIAWLEARAELLSGRGEHGPAGRAWRE